MSLRRHIRPFLPRSVVSAYGAALQRKRRSRGHKRRLVRDYLGSTHEPKLHIGCGDHALDGWLNTDFEWLRDDVLYLDATEPFPLPSNSFDLIFSEHMIEHIPLASTSDMLDQCLRVLKPGGRIRISTPPLEFLIALMTRPDDEHRRYMEWHFAEWDQGLPVLTPAVVVADYYRNWGHQFVYDELTLRALLEQAGFQNIERPEIGVSSDPRLCGLENEERIPPGLLRLSTFTLEAVKP